MYVCICNGYRDAEIRDLAESGIRSAKMAYRALGNGPRCGQCLRFAQDLINGVHGDGEADAPTAVYAG